MDFDSCSVAESQIRESYQTDYFSAILVKLAGPLKHREVVV